MAFCIVQLDNQVWTIVLKENIKNRIKNEGQCSILEINQKVTIIGCHEDYHLLSEMCSQQNRREFTIDIYRNDFRKI